MPLYKNSLKPTYFFDFCQQFVVSFVPRLISSIEKCKRISEIGAQHLLLDVTTLKSALQNLPYMGTPPTGSPPSGVQANMYTKILNIQVTRADILLKLLLSPVELLLDTFNTLMPEGTETELEKILDLKGLKGSDKSDILRKINAGTPTTTTQSTSSSPIKSPRPDSPDLLSNLSPPNSFRPQPQKSNPQFQQFQQQIQQQIQNQLPQIRQAGKKIVEGFSDMLH